MPQQSKKIVYPGDKVRLRFDNGCVVQIDIPHPRNKALSETELYWLELSGYVVESYPIDHAFFGYLVF